MAFVAAVIAAASTAQAKPEMWIALAVLATVYLAVVLLTGDPPGGPTDR